MIQEKKKSCLAVRSTGDPTDEADTIFLGKRKSVKVQTSQRKVLAADRTVGNQDDDLVLANEAIYTSHSGLMKG